MRPQVRSEAAYLKKKGESNSTSGSKSVGNSPRGRKVVNEKPGSAKLDLFLREPRSTKEVSKDVIKADCMIHGYRAVKTIGEGAYAKVKLAEVMSAKLVRIPILAELAEANENCLQVAIKVIENKQVPKEFLKKFLPRELSNHCPLPPHKNVVRVFEQFQTTERYYVVMEYCNKGDLLDLINDRIAENHRGLGEDRTRSLFKQMVEGVQHIHNNGIAHRDLKCENILIGEDYTVKVTDFGFSTKFDGKESLLRTSCGSYAYTAPEVIKCKPYNGFKTDIWSLGIILFAMLNGRLPFNDSQLMEMEEDMKVQRLRFERHVSFDAMVMVRRILQYNPAQRSSLQEILNDSWITGKKMIPRQMHRPKWVNPYEAKPDDVSGVTDEVVRSNPVCYKATVPERSHDARVTVKHNGNETVKLNSRADPKKNIWTCGPAIVARSRPNTWPGASATGKNQKTGRNHGNPCRGSRGYVRNASVDKTLVVRNAPKNRKDNTPSSTGGTVKFSKSYIDKLVKKTTEVDKTENADAERLSKLDNGKSENSKEIKDSDDKTPQKTNLQQNKQPESASEENRTSPKPASKENEVFKNQTKTTALQRNKQSNPGKLPQKELKGHASEEDLDRMFPDLKRMDQEFDLDDYLNDYIHDVDIKPNPEDVASEKRAPSRTSQVSSKRQGPTCPKIQEPRRIPDKMCSQSGSPESNKRTGTTSVKTPSLNKPNTGSANTTPPLDISGKNLNRYMVDRSPNPVGRAKWVRERMTKLYASARSFKASDNTSGLPPLMVAAIRPCDKTNTKTGSRAKSSGPRVKTANAQTKPVHRVIVHSAV